MNGTSGETGRLTERQFPPAHASLGFVFGTLDAVAVPGPILVELMGRLGVREATTRQVLSRLTAQGDLTVARFGRVTVYALAATMLGRWHRLRSGDAPRPWTGGFHAVVYDIPERYRRQRDSLHQQATWKGFGSPRPGLLLGLESTGDWLTQWRADVGPLPPDMLVAPGEFVTDLATARELASRAWRLDAVREDLEWAQGALQELLNRRMDDGDPMAAFADLHEAFVRVGGVKLAAPDLPVELLPADWPARRIHATLEQVAVRRGHLVWQLIAEVLSASPHVGLVQHADPRLVPSYT